MWGILGQSQEDILPSLRHALGGDLHFCHLFLLVPETPIPLLGRNLLSKLKVQVLLPPGEYFCISLIEEQVDLSVWMDISTLGGQKKPLPFLFT
jgi:hypothetical protein